MPNEELISPESSENQQVQQELVEEGMKLPGVAEALEAYTRVAGFSNLAALAQVQIRNATGANA
jgi:hypothetical protein